MKPTLIVIAGPTASGKTDISIDLAKKINGEIISADSMQVYKYMDIGTAKPTKDEMRGITHYMIDELYPDEDFSVAVFQQRAKKYLQTIYDKGKIPIVAGGTGFYINSLLNDNNFMETKVDCEYRKYLYDLCEKEGNEYLHSILKQVDPESADAIHCNNVKRVIRALEYYAQRGEKISAHNQAEKQKDNPYHTVFIILDMNRQLLYERIDTRVDKMLRDGLIQEVQNLLNMGYSEKLVSMQGLGYKEIIQYLKGSLTLDEAVFILKRDTRHFAKRQLTWFKNKSTGCWLNIDVISNRCIIVDTIVNYLSESFVTP